MGITTTALLWMRGCRDEWGGVLVDYTMAPSSSSSFNTTTTTRSGVKVSKASVYGVSSSPLLLLRHMHGCRYRPWVGLCHIHQVVSLVFARSVGGKTIVDALTNIPGE